MVTTLITNLPNEAQMASKQVQICSEYLKDYIEAIRARVAENSAILREQSKQLNPPYPFIGLEEADEMHQLSILELVVHSSLLAMSQNINTIPQSFLTSCIEEYLNNCPRGLGEDRYAGITNPWLSDAMITLIDQINLAIVAMNLDILNQKSRKKTASYKLTANLAIIWLGRQLAQEKETASQSPLNS